jgi:hypothetical protein
LHVGDSVSHESWGDGLVTHTEVDIITVLFDTVGYKTFDARMVEERGLLQRSVPTDSDEAPAA